MAVCRSYARVVVRFAGVGLLLSGCAQTPMGPSVQVMPGQGKSFDAFQADQAACKSFATDQVKGQADAANQRAIGTALVSTALGAGLGAAVGNVNGVAGQGAGVGGAAGGIVGTGLAAAQTSQGDQPMIQAQYDNAFSQCMYSKGNIVPGYAAPAVASAAPVAGPDPALVRSIQGELVRLSYLKDPPDGMAGPKTRGAIRAFEQSHGMKGDGAPTQTVLAKLQATPTSAGAAPTASAPANWVTPGSSAPAGAATLTPAAATTPAAPSGWVSPTKTQ